MKKLSEEYISDFGMRAEKLYTEKLYNRRNINEKIIMDNTSVYELDENCMNQMKGVRCNGRKGIVWEMDCMLDVRSCDLILVDV